MPDTEDTKPVLKIPDFLILSRCYPKYQARNNAVTV